MMVQGVDAICDSAIEKWYSGKYSQDWEVIQQNIARFKKAKQRVREIKQDLSQSHASQDTR